MIGVRNTISYLVQETDTEAVARADCRVISVRSGGEMQWRWTGWMRC